jgi:hypothetical protein
MPNNCWAKHLGCQVAKATLWTQGDTAHNGKDWPMVPFPWRPSTTRAFRHRHAAFLPALTPVQATASPHSSSPRQTLQRAKGNHAHTALRSTCCTGTTRQSSDTGDHLRPRQVPTMQSDRSQPSTAATMTTRSPHNSPSTLRLKRGNDWTSIPLYPMTTAEKMTSKHMPELRKHCSTARKLPHLGNIHSRHCRIHVKQKPPSTRIVTAGTAAS